MSRSRLWRRIPGWEGAVSRLTALVPGAVCAAALGRGWPDEVDEQVRCLDEGSPVAGAGMVLRPKSR